MWKDHIDLDPDQIVDRFGPNISPADALAYGIAAIRETLEEAGVFFAHRDDETSQHLERISRMRRAENLDNDWFQNLVVTAPLTT